MKEIDKKKLKHLNYVRDLIKRTPLEWSKIVAKQVYRDIGYLQLYASNAINFEKELITVHRDYKRKIEDLENEIKELKRGEK